MPLKKSTLKRHSSDSTGDTGYNTLDSLDESSRSEFGTDPIDSNLDDDEPADEWLESMGVAAEEIRKIKSKQVQNAF